MPPQPACDDIVSAECVTTEELVSRIKSFRTLNAQNRWKLWQTAQRVAANHAHKLSFDYDPEMTFRGLLEGERRFGG